MSIEVEHKFLVVPHTQAKLVSLGARREGCESFKDIYYDTKDHSITFRDFWLRQRDGAWQLKYPIREHTSKPLTDQYNELETEKDILDQLMTSGAVSFDEQCDHINLDQLVSESVLICIAEFITTRESWSLIEDGSTEHVSIALDTTNFDYDIGEVELMVGSPALVAEAERRVRELAEKIGVCVVWSYLLHVIVM